MLHRKCECGNHTMSSKCGACSGEEQTLRRRAAGNSSQTEAPAVVHDVLNSSGQPLDRQTKAFFEPRFAREFSRVRVHADAQAAESAKAVSARAYTVGNHIVFSAGRYKPETAQGRALLAHELAHVVQQKYPSGGSGPIAIAEPGSAEEADADEKARRVTSDVPIGSAFQQTPSGGLRLQRQADINRAPTDLPCILLEGAGHDEGTNLLFAVASAVVTANHRLNIATMVRSWRENGSRDDFIVEGFASVEGPQAFNWRLSCNRAEAVKAELIAQGVPANRITTFAQGETTTFSARALIPNRRVIISTVPGAAPVPAAPAPAAPAPAAPAPGGPAPAPGAAPAPARPAPILSATINTPPTPTTCGGMNFVINWQLSGNSAANGGFIIQEVLFNWNVNDCKGVPVPNPDPRVSPLLYFEAWRVAPNSTNLTPVTTDTFFWPDARPWAGRSTTGNVTITAIAHYHDNVAALPAHMQALNGATFAGTLQSSLVNPGLGAPVSPAVPHSLTFHWNCCPIAVRRTVLDGHQP